MKNSAMKPNRFLFWHIARKKLAFIRANLAAGKTVVISNHYKAWALTEKHADRVKANRGGIFFLVSKNWVCFDGCKISVHP